MKPITLKSLIEQLDVSNPVNLDRECNEFAKNLLSNGLIKSVHKDLTAADTPSSDFSEDLGEVIKNSVVHWTQVNNQRAGR